MATITAKITISSSDLTSDVLSLSKTFNLTSAAGAGINQTSGLTRLNGLNSITTIFAAANFSVDEAYLFLNNTELMAIDPSALDIKLTADQASTTVEYQLFHNG